MAASGYGITQNFDQVTRTPLSGDSFLNALLEGSKWGGAVGTGAMIYYSFSGSAAEYVGTASSSVVNGFAALNGSEQSLVRTALAAWSAVANIQFVEVTDNIGDPAHNVAGAVGDIRFAKSTTMPAGAGGLGEYPDGGSGAVGGDVWFDPSSLDNSKDGYNLQLVEHEIGHALGLKHPFDSGAGGILPTAYDYYLYTIMSYSSHPLANQGGLGATGVADLSTNAFPTTPMFEDIAAIQYLYGKSTTPTAVYSFSAARPGFAVIENSRAAVTVDASATTQNSIINLTPGSFSEINGYVQPDPGTSNPPTAYPGVFLEADSSVGNLLCGSGNNSIIAYGNCTISGGGGNDTIIAGVGTELIDGGSGTDVVSFATMRRVDVGFTLDSQSNLLAREAGATVSLKGVETLAFADQSVSVASIIAGLSAQSSWSIAPAALAFEEGGLATLTISRSSSATVESVAIVGVDDLGFTNNNDYLPPTPSLLTFAVGESSKIVSIQTINDTVVESNESFSLVVQSADGLHTELARRTFTIVDNDNPTFIVTTIAGGRAPERAFNSAYYLAQNPDVKTSGMDPQTHYDLFGWKEGRNPDALFNTSYYLSQNPDVKQAGMDPLLHYEQFGWKEGRAPSANFSTKSYLAHNPDVALAGINPLDHFLLFGAAEHRQL